jgi:hypothetical protein
MRILRPSLVVVVPLLLIVLPALGVGGLYGIRAVESYNPFCTSCHLQDHQDYLDDGARPKTQVRSLGGRHLSSGKVKCISCHGEEGINKLDQKVRVGQGALPRNRDRLAGATSGPVASSVVKLN